MDIRGFHRRLFDAARTLWPDGAVVVCAASGGADSTAMLHGLCAVNRIRRAGWTLHAAHFDHGLRAESGEDAECVRAEAAALGLGFSSERANVRAHARRARRTVEEAGRQLRYAFFERTAETIGARHVAVAHHADDQAETVFHHVARGTGLRGLAGMPARRPIRRASRVDVVRPMLGFRREELRAYLSLRGIPYREDRTNADGSATRNRIRGRVFPLIESAVNPRFVEALLRLAEHAGRAADAMDAWAASAKNAAMIHRGDGRAFLSAAAVANLPAAVRTAVIVEVLRAVGASLQSVSFERIEAAAELATGAGRRRHVELPGGWIVERRGRELIVRRARDGSALTNDRPRSTVDSCIRV